MLDPIKLQRLLQDYLELMMCGHVKITSLLNSSADLFEFNIEPHKDKAQEQKIKTETKDSIQVSNMHNKKQNTTKTNKHSNAEKKRKK